MSLSNGPPDKTFGIDRVHLRLAIVGTLVVACFVALFSRLWFLQVLAAEDYRQQARNNRVRRVETEPPRGRILDRNMNVLVSNRKSLAVTVDRQVVDRPRKERRVLRRLSDVLGNKVKDMRLRLHDGTVSPYKPVAVANDVPERKVYWILEHKDRFPGVGVEELPVRRYPQGGLAAHILGYVNEISPDQLDSDHFKGARPRYRPGDLVGQSGLEWSYDRYLRGRPGLRKVVVNAAGEVVSGYPVRSQKPGRDLVLSLDAGIQRLAERALMKGILAARSSYQAPGGAVVVMDPDDGHVLGMASYPTFKPSILADGITTKEFDRLGQATPDDRDDDALPNRAIQSGVPPGSTFKPVTAGAALWSGVATPYTALDCPGSKVYPPEGGPGSEVFNNWTSADYGYMGFPESLEVSCDTFYYELGWRLESAFGVSLDSGDGSEKFQKYMRMAGFGQDTGVDLANEFDGRVPDKQWCNSIAEETNGAICPYGWLPGYTVNISIGQGELLVSPLQMAVTYAAIANGGRVLEPRLGMALARTGDSGDERVIREFEPTVVRRLPLDSTELSAIQQGLVDVVSGEQGTAAGAFAGFPTDRYPIAGKTGTAQIGEVDSGLNYAWFTSYAPADDPEYVVVVYLEKAGHGGESAAPVARQVYEGLFDIDRSTEVQLSQDSSG